MNPASRWAAAAAAGGLALLLASGPAPAQQAITAPCPAGGDSMTVAELYFGRNIGGRPGVSRAEWRRFLDGEVTPRFPDGLTVHDGAGQYRGADGRLVREPSKILTLILPALNDETRARLAAVADAYKQRFRQESVMTVLRPACVSF